MSSLVFQVRLDECACRQAHLLAAHLCRRSVSGLPSRYLAICLAGWLAGLANGGVTKVFFCRPRAESARATLLRLSHFETQMAR